eukprot:PhF_6_TR39682/c0_g1_i1/m.58957/K19191/mabO; 4-methylaminobutanoate oxidase (formaldehyde-forming)
MATLPSKANVVIVGGGIIGCSIAYHLSKAGVTDVLLLERNKLSSGTTWHAAGLVGQLRATETETKISAMGAQVFPTLAADTGQDIGFKQCGSLTLSRCKDRTTLLKRNAARATAFGIKAELLSMDDVAKLVGPLVSTSPFDCALWLPNDGTASPSDACTAFAKGAKKYGAKLYEGIGVKQCIVQDGPFGKSAQGVELENGQRILCEAVVNCGGMWSRDFGKANGVTIPLHPCEHYYIVTGPMQGVSTNLPVLRDPDRWAYYREWSGGLVVGAFETDARACFLDGIPKNFQNSLLPDDYEHFEPILRHAMECIPALETTPIRTMVNGPESFTIDNQYCMGEVPEIRGYFVAAGMNSSGIAGSSGVGWAMSHWIMNHRPPHDLWTVDVRRFGPFHDNLNFVRERCVEALGKHYEIPYPRLELKSGRGLRRSPAAVVLQQQGAVFGSKFGWERPNYFLPKTDGKQNDLPEYSFGITKWHPIVRAEQQATRTNVSVFDVTSFAKFLIQGPRASEFCNYVFANNMLGPIGSVVYGPMLNHAGGYESDVTVSRLGENEYMVVSPTAQGSRDFHWLQTMRREQNIVDVTISDVSSSYAVFSVQGPKAHMVMAAVSNTSPEEWKSKTSFPANTFKRVEVGNALVRACRISYVGEDGWELYVPCDFALGAYECLFEKGAAFSIAPAGYYCMEAMRISRGYRAWGHEVSPDDNPYEAGLSFAVDLKKKSDFCGKAAMLKLKDVPRSDLKRRLVSVMLDQRIGESVIMWGGEAVYRDDVCVGYLRSAAFVDALGVCGGLGYVTNNGNGVSNEYLSSGVWSVNVAGKMVPAKVTLKSLVDAFGKK